jgi:hypothetical protein
MTASRQQPERRSLDLMEVLKYIGSPIALGTALLFYFGWVRSHAQAEAFGVDVSVFEMSTDDLVLRSINVLFFPLIFVLLGGLVFLRLDPWFKRHARRAAPILGHAWLLVVLGLVLLVIHEPLGNALLPLWVLMAIAGMAYASRLRRLARDDQTPRPTAQALLVGALFVVILFWATERFAQAGGQALANQLKNAVADRSQVSLFTKGRLHVEGSGVTETALSGQGSVYGYRYDGLYLLQRSGDKYFLLTDGWQDDPSQGRLVVLPDDESIRLEFGRLPVVPTADGP